MYRQIRTSLWDLQWKVSTSLMLSRNFMSLSSYYHFKYSLQKLENEKTGCEREARLTLSVFGLLWQHLIHQVRTLTPHNSRNVSLRCGCQEGSKKAAIPSITFIGKRKKESEVFFFFISFLIRERIPSWEFSLMRALSPNIITLGIKVSTYEFWEDVSICGKHFPKLKVKYKHKCLQNVRHSWQRGKRMGGEKHQQNSWSKLETVCDGREPMA